ncbi:MAG: ORC1-type DNA replication protein [Theionarchaea archaeon]|nr:ORC1-type DNA replication protein [Theionarchaea archaeon]
MNRREIKDILLYDETLIRNDRIFDPQYTPERFNFRDSQLQQLSYHLKPCMRGGTPVNTLILGPCGTGKTTSVKLVMEEAEHSSDKIIPVYINCQFSATPFQTFSQIYRKVIGHSPPETGVPLTRVQKEIMKRLQREEKCLVVVLDDMDHLFYDKYANDILYDILRAHEKYDGVRTGIFGIVSENEFRFVLATKVHTIFNPSEIFFEPYTRSQIYDILTDRVRAGLVDGVLSDELLGMIADTTVASGDLRVGIELVYRSALEAEADGSRTIKKNHIDRAYSAGAKVIHLKRILHGLEPAEKALLKILAETKGEMPSKELYDQFSDRTGHKLKKYNALIGKLEALRLIDAPYVKKVGRTRRIVLRYEESDIIKLLK